jgi:hypothetical protein
MARHQERFLVAAEYKGMEEAGMGQGYLSQNDKISRLDAGCRII